MWPSCLGRWCCNTFPGSRPPSCHYPDLFLGSPEFKSSVTLCNLVVCLLPVGIFNYVDVYLKYLLPLFQWHACKLAYLSACIVKCMTIINHDKICIFLHYIYSPLQAKKVKYCLKQLEHAFDRSLIFVVCVRIVNNCDRSG